MITKHQVLKELKQRIKDGDFLDYVVEVKNGTKYHQVKYGLGVMISIAEDSRNMYINFAFNRNEKEEVLELLKNTTPIVSEKTKPSFFNRLFSKSK